MIYNFMKTCLIIIQYSNPVLENGKNGDNGQTVIDLVSMVSVLENEHAVQVQQRFVTDLSVTWKFAIKISVMIGQQKVGLTGQVGAIVRKHVVGVLESDDEFVKIPITIAMIQG